jgi:anti-sigma factor RsiW
MNNQFSTHDYELISAYLDNQLSAKEREQFEIRLKAEPALRMELQEIGKTRALLRNMPKLKAPHNYFIKVEPVRAKSRLRLAPLFGVISAIASIILILLIFGSALFSDAGPVVMSPALQSQPATQAPVGESERSVSKVITPTAQAPSVMMAAPSSATTAPSESAQIVGEAVTPSGSAQIVGETAVPSESAPITGGAAAPNESAPITGEAAVPSPTTIYLYAYPPTATSENEITAQNEQSTATEQNCQDYYSGGGSSTTADVTNCPTPTGEAPLFLQSILSSITPTPTITGSLTTTVTLTPTETPSPTETLTLTETPTSSITPSPTASPTPFPTDTPQASLKLAPEVGVELATRAPSPIQEVGVNNQATSVQGQSETSRAAPDVSFLHYLLLSVEISLAVIAVIAGIVAIILRIWAR